MMSKVDPSVSVVITAYNMEWCVARAIESCQRQTLKIKSIIVVDDCSKDKTSDVVQGIAARDSSVLYVKPEKNGGHLSSIRLGCSYAETDWIVFLDADDELTLDSVESRMVAAKYYQDQSGTKPQLVYGDHVVTKFPRLSGYSFSFITKELCLCQTSSMMIGKEAVSYLPVTDNWNTDDEIVLSISKHFHVLHCGSVVTIYHPNDSVTRMSNNYRKVYQGVADLVRDHARDIVDQHGSYFLFLWKCRVLKAWLIYRLRTLWTPQNLEGPGLRGWLLATYVKTASRLLSFCLRIVRRFLRGKFDYDYF